MLNEESAYKRYLFYFILLVYKVDLYAGEERRSKSQWHPEQGINERKKIFKER